MAYSAAGGFWLDDKMEYELTVEVGEGRFANVWKAREKVTRKILAVKVFKRSGTPEHEVFRRHVARNEDLLLQGAQGGPHIIAAGSARHLKNGRRSVEIPMDFYEHDLSYLLAISWNSRGLVDDVIVVPSWYNTVLNQMLLALEYLHGKDVPIVHRDIRPQNILYNNTNHFVLADFGHARLGLASGSEHNMSYRFMPPEMYNRRPQTKSADIWSLGILCLDMLVLVPFVSDEDHEIERMKSRMWCDDIREFAKHCNKPEVEMMVRIRPDDRATASALLRFLKESTSTQEEERLPTSVEIVYLIFKEVDKYKDGLKERTYETAASYLQSFGSSQPGPSETGSPRRGVDDAATQIERRQNETMRSLSSEQDLTVRDLAVAAQRKFSSAKPPTAEAGESSSSAQPRSLSSAEPLPQDIKDLMESHGLNATTGASSSSTKAPEADLQTRAPIRSQASAGTYFIAGSPRPGDQAMMDRLGLTQVSRASDLPTRSTRAPTGSQRPSSTAIVPPTGAGGLGRVDSDQMLLEAGDVIFVNTANSTVPTLGLPTEPPRGIRSSGSTANALLPGAGVLEGVDLDEPLSAADIHFLNAMNIGLSQPPSSVAAAAPTESQRAGRPLPSGSAKKRRKRSQEVAGSATATANPLATASQGEAGPSSPTSKKPPRRSQGEAGPSSSISKTPSKQPQEKGGSSSSIAKTLPSGSPETAGLSKQTAASNIEGKRSKEQQQESVQKDEARASQASSISPAAGEEQRESRQTKEAQASQDAKTVSAPSEQGEALGAPAAAEEHGESAPKEGAPSSKADRDQTAVRKQRDPVQKRQTQGSKATRARSIGEEQREFAQKEDVPSSKASRKAKRRSVQKAKAGPSQAAIEVQTKPEQKEDSIAKALAAVAAAEAANEQRDLARKRRDAMTSQATKDEQPKPLGKGGAGTSIAARIEQRVSITKREHPAPQPTRPSQSATIPQAVKPSQSATASPSVRPSQPTRPLQSAPISKPSWPSQPALDPLSTWPSLSTGPSQSAAASQHPRPPQPATAPAPNPPSQPAKAPQPANPSQSARASASATIPQSTRAPATASSSPHQRDTGFPSQPGDRGKSSDSPRSTASSQRSTFSSPRGSNRSANTSQPLDKKIPRQSPSEGQLAPDAPSWNPEYKSWGTPSHERPWPTYHQAPAPPPATSAPSQQGTRAPSDRSEKSRSEASPRASETGSQRGKDGGGGGGGGGGRSSSGGSGASRQPHPTSRQSQPSEFQDQASPSSSRSSVATTAITTPSAEPHSAPAIPPGSLPPRNPPTTSKTAPQSRGPTQTFRDNAPPPWFVQPGFRHPTVIPTGPHHPLPSPSQAGGGMYAYPAPLAPLTPHPHPYLNPSYPSPPPPGTWIPVVAQGGAGGVYLGPHPMQQGQQAHNVPSGGRGGSRWDIRSPGRAPPQIPLRGRGGRIAGADGGTGVVDGGGAAGGGEAARGNSPPVSRSGSQELRGGTVELKEKKGAEKREGKEGGREKGDQG